MYYVFIRQGVSSPCKVYFAQFCNSANRQVLLNMKCCNKVKFNNDSFHPTGDLALMINDVYASSRPWCLLITYLRIIVNFNNILIFYIFLYTFVHVAWLPTIGLVALASHLLTLGCSSDNAVSCRQVAIHVPQNFTKLEKKTEFEIHCIFG